MRESLEEKLYRENITIASINKRVLAYAIDDIIISVLFMLIYWDYIARASDIGVEATLAAISNLFWQIALMKVAYHTFFIWYYAATPGKMLCKLVCIDTVMLSRPSLSSSFLRACMRLLSETLFYIGFLWALGNSQRQTWQDKLAKTVVCNAY
ncbi:MAG: RDD family protein [Campylobacter sp.]|nr:RDD family protein [Campylobacter sp.]